MKLHVKKIIDRASWKTQQNNQKYYLIGALFLFSLPVVMITYHFYIMFFLLFFIIIIVLIASYIQNIKSFFDLKRLKSEVVNVDENQCFVYQDKVFDFHQLIKIHLLRRVIYLEFENDIVVLEYQKTLFNQLKDSYSQLINQKTTKIGRISFKLWMIDMFFGVIIIMKIVGGIIYCLSTSTTIIDISRLFGDIGTLAFIFICVFLANILKKYKIVFYTVSVIVAFWSLMSPMTHVTQLLVDQGAIAYREDVNGVQIYRDVAYVFGKDATLMYVDSIDDIGTFHDVVYVESQQQYQFYSLTTPHQTLQDLYEEYEGSSYSHQDINIAIDKNAIKINSKPYQAELIGDHMLYVKLQHPYIIQFKDFRCELYQLDRGHTVVLQEDYMNDVTSQDNDIENEEKKSQEENQDNETVTASPSQPEEKSEIEKRREKQDQQRYQAYQQAIQQDDMTSFQSTQDVVKVHDENTDIYRVIKSLDREITRINNEEGTILDVQILSMLIYHQNNDEYGIYINRRVDSSVEESQTFQEIIFMKKYGHDYIGTRLYDISYMPTDHPTNNGEYETRQTTDYLYRIDGHQVVENAW